jgi:CheY-like chemotaxis protein
MAGSKVDKLIRELSQRDILAEGSPRHEIYQEGDPLLLTVLPSLPITRLFERTAETGRLSASQLFSEGHDMTDRQDASRQPEENRASLAPQHAPLVMIVEDALELAEIMQATLERAEMKTYHQTHGERALASLDRVHPDVILLDIALPDITGWKFLDELKERYSRKNALHLMPSVIVITALGDPANRLVGKLQGVYSYLIKPIRPNELEATVREALSCRH